MNGLSIKHYLKKKAEPEKQVSSKDFKRSSEGLKYYVPDSFENDFRNRKRWERIRIRNHLSKATPLEVKILSLLEEERLLLGYSRYLRLYISIPITEFFSHNTLELLRESGQDALMIAKDFFGNNCQVVLTELIKETGRVMASRVRALELKKERAFFNKKPQKNLYPGETVSGQIIAVTPQFTVLEFAGIEKTLEKRELFFSTQVGEHLQVKITVLSKDVLNKEVLELKYKIENLTKKDWYINAKDLKVGEELRGIIIFRRPGGVILRIKNNMTLFAPYVEKDLASELKVGSQILVVLKKIDYRGRRLFGKMVL